MSRSNQSLTRRIILIAILLGGGYLVLSALWGMCRTAIYIHETIPVTGTVIDLRQRPFESNTEALGNGNLSTSGDTAYFPIVSFTFDNGANISKLALTVPDNEPPRMGDPIELRTYPYDPMAPDKAPWRPEGVQPNRASFLWGGHALQLLFGLTIGGIAYLMLRSRRSRPAAAKSPAKPKHTPAPAPQKKTPPPAPAPAAEDEPFMLSPEPTEAPKKKRAPRPRKPADPNAPKKPRAPRKKKEQDPNAPPKPRKPRKKKQSDLPE